MDNLKLISKPIGSLVADRPFNESRIIFVTVSPNPKTKHTIRRKTINGKMITCQLPYGRIAQINQYEYCLHFVNCGLMRYLSGRAAVIGTWELNESGNVHLHILIQDPKIQTKVDLDIFRRQVENHPISMHNKHSSKSPDYMNNIVYLDKPLDEIITYMDKDYVQNHPFFNNFMSF